jgi:diguanylate cyclase (GGDEF)-like protein
LNRRGFKIAVSRKFLHEEELLRRVMILFIDLDGFKMINDLHGHIEGDKALLVMTETLRETFGKRSIIGRWGGDEFIVAIVDNDENADANFSERLHEKLNELCEKYNLTYQLRVSIGSSDSERSNSYVLDKLLADADRDLYRQKRAVRVPRIPHPTKK